jgi:hypothetical protein
MRIILSVVRPHKQHFRLYTLTTLFIICIISSQFIGTNPTHVNTDPNLTLQDHLRIASSQTGSARSTNHMTPLQQPEPTTSVTPTPTPDTTKPTQTGGIVPPVSSQAMPTGDMLGWRQIFAEDFNTAVPIGDFPGTIYSSKFSVYPNGTQDTAGKQGALSRYYPSKVASVSNGLLNLYLHTENGTPMAAAILPTLLGNHLYGKYTIRFRSDALQGFKVAWLLWPDSGNWPYDGEMDFPESGLEGTIGAFMHRNYGTSSNDQDAYNTTATYTSWHTASIEWSPNAVNFVLDGESIGTSTARIPNTPMHWVLQTEACLPTCPAATTAGNLQIDWITAYAPA